MASRRGSEPGGSYRDGGGTCAVTRTDKQTNQQTKSGIRNALYYCEALSGECNLCSDLLSTSPGAQSPLHLFTNIKGVSTMSVFAACASERRQPFVLRAFQMFRQRQRRRTQAIINYSVAFFSPPILFLLLFVCRVFEKTKNKKTPLKENKQQRAAAQTPIRESHSHTTH